MSRTEKKVEMHKRYCPVCRFDTQHAVLTQTRFGFDRVDELRSACGVCDSDGFWRLRFPQPLAPAPKRRPAVARAVPGA